MQSYSYLLYLYCSQLLFISIQDRCVFNMLQQVQTCFTALADLFYHWSVACRIILMCIFLLQIRKSCIFSLEKVLIPIFVHNNSHNYCILYHQSYVRGLVTLCLASTANHSTFIYRMNDEGLAVLTTLWIGTRFALEWTYIGSIFTIHYKVDSLLNQPFYPLTPIPKIRLISPFILQIGLCRNTRGDIC